MTRDRLPVPNASPPRRRRWIVETFVTAAALGFVAFFHEEAIHNRVMLSFYFLGVVSAAYLLVRRRAMLMMELVVCAAVGRTLAGVYFAAKPGISDPVLLVAGDLAFWFVVLYLGWRLAAESYRFQEAEIQWRVTHTVDEQASAARGAAIVTTSREIRQPLATIRTITDALLSDPPEALSENQQESLADMDRCISQLMGLVDSLCDYGQAEAGLVRLHCEPVALAELIEQCVGAVRSRASSAGVQVHSHVSADVGQIVADPLRLKQVLLTLLSNAVYSNKEGGVVSLQARPLNGDVMVSVRDTGKGMSDEAMAALFDPYRDHSQDMPQVAASVELSLVKRLVEMHRGTMVVESVAESGTVFTVRLPREAAAPSRRGWVEAAALRGPGAATPVAASIERRRSDVSALPEAANRSRPASNDEESAEGETGDVTRVLVADANVSVRRVLGQWLKSLGCEMVEADAGPSAMELAHARPMPHVILLDAKLPQIDGFELCRALKADTRLRMIPVVLVTAIDTADEKTRAFEAGADDFLVKPINRAELAVRLGSLLRIYKFTHELIGAESVAMALARAVAAKDGYSQAHVGRVADYAVMLGEKLGLDVAELKSLKYGAILHNVGKIAVPDAVLEKAGPLTPREMALFQQHPQIGCDICTPLKPLKPVLGIIRHHKEHWDGSGFPDRLSGNDIPLGAQIVGLVDAYTAMVSNRPYRKALPYAEAIAILRTQAADGWYNPELLDRFVECLEGVEETPARVPSESLVPVEAM